MAVQSGTISYAVFGLKSPIDNSGTNPVGALILESVVKERGDAFVDDLGVGELPQEGQLTIANLTAGQHTYRIILSGGRSDQVLQGSVTIKPNETTYAVPRVRPGAPTNLLTTVQ